MDHQALFNEIYLHQIYFKQQNHSLFNLFVSILKCLIVKNVKTKMHNFFCPELRCRIIHW